MNRIPKVAALTLATLVCILASALTTARAQAPAAPQPPQPDESAIRATMETQVNAWNQGNISAFMSSYEDSPETTFVGATSINKGFQPILERYKHNYATREQMGTLTFSELVIRLLPSASGPTEYAVVTGHFHLDRSAKGAATKDDGIFSLVFHKSAGQWKILLDHTS